VSTSKKTCFRHLFANFFTSTRVGILKICFGI
jgi:hypothetical protein